MMDRIDDRAPAAHAARRRYLWSLMLLFLVGLSVGATVALAEHCAWFPRRLSGLFAFPSTTPPSPTSLIGLVFTQTLPIPLLFLAGLHRITFYYTARIFCFVFWFWRGLDIWKFLVLMRADMWQSPIAIFLMLITVLGMTYPMLRSVITAATGVSHAATEGGLRPAIYLVTLLQYWGAMMLVQAAFYLLYICFL